jgi:hypothetical protein
MLEKKNDALIAAKAVLARYGGICGMTLHRWVRDPDLNFPKRLLINGRRYWRLSEAARLGIRGPDAFNPQEK